MGQSTSRPQRDSVAYAQDTAPATSTTNGAPTVSSSSEVTAKRQPRSSMAQSMRNIIRPTERRTRHDSSIGSSSSSNPRQWWMKTRRRVRSEVGVGGTSDIVTEEDGTVTGGVAGEQMQGDGLDLVEKVRSDSGPDFEEAERPSTPYPTSVSHITDAPQDVDTTTGLASPAQRTSSNIGSWLGAQSPSLARAVNIPLPGEDRTDEDEVVISPISGLGSSSGPSTVSSTNESPLSTETGGTTDDSDENSASESPHLPPGTFVIVQGIVQTTEITLPNPSAPSEQHANAEATSTDSHEDSTTSPSPTFRSGGRPRHPLSSLFSRSSGSHRRTPSAPPALRYGPVGTGSIAVPPPQNPPPTHEPSPSDSTITAEVVDGAESAIPTLESTGPVDPTNPPSNFSSNSVDVLSTLLSVAAAATAASLLSGSSEPIFTSGLTSSSSAESNSDSSAGESEPRLRDLADIGHSALHNSRERVSRAWDNLRNRLGLRPSGSTGAGGSQPVNSISTILSDMARAFNLGLGLPRTRLTASDDGNDGDSADDLSHSSFAEGTFERFLADLQNGLRSELSLPNSVVASSQSSSGESNDDTTDSENREQRTQSSTTPQDTAEQNVPSSSSQYNASAPPVVAQHPVISSSSASSSMERSHASRATPSLDVRPPSRSSEPINWWIFHRFTPVTLPPESASASDESQDSSSTSTMIQNAMQAGAVSPAADGANSHSATPRRVVPTVIVGLRSVNVGSDEDTQTPNEETPIVEENSRTDAEDTSRRSWPARSAAALRSFRENAAGRTPEVRTRGGRTFLIFVIGGYYSPDAAFFADPTVLPSIEWEIPELWSSLRAPTASKEEIEKSGLQVIKATDLARYEQEGKISSNCTDKCLICLDEYDPEDEVRLLTCRHGFHKTCVDTWLETGRNNCPACRSTGVGLETPVSS